MSFTAGVHKFTSPFTHAISRTDISKDEKLAKSRCIIFQRERLPVEQFWLRVCPFHGTKGARAGVMNTVLQKFSTSKEQDGGKGNAIRHEKPLRAGCIKKNLTHGSLPGLEDRHCKYV